MSTPDVSPNPEKGTHPEWLAVGSEVEIVRSHGRSVAHRRRAKVARHTKMLVILDNGDRFRRARFPADTYELTPAYLDYRTKLVSPIAGSGTSDG